MKRAAVLIDGGHLRVLVRRQARRSYDPDYIIRVAHACIGPDEEMFSRFYYDCASYNGAVKLPISGRTTTFAGSAGWLQDLASRDLFAVRLGVLTFRGFKPKRIPITPEALSDDDFRPDFEPKGVDMRIGLDIAAFSVSRAVDRIIMLTNDTDCIPAMKHGWKAGRQIVLIALPGHRVAAELLPHADFHRSLAAWPS